MSTKHGEQTGDAEFNGIRRPLLSGHFPISDKPIKNYTRTCRECGKQFTTIFRCKRRCYECLSKPTQSEQVKQTIDLFSYKTRRYSNKPRYCKTCHGLLEKYSLREDYCSFPCEEVAKMPKDERKYKQNKVKRAENPKEYFHIPWNGYDEYVKQCQLTIERNMR